MIKILQPQNGAPCFTLLLATNNQCQFRVIIQQEKRIVKIAINTDKYLLRRPNLKWDVLI